MAVTLKEIADELGVSRMTVSRVLSGKSRGQVSAAVAEKVKAALERHHYRPNLNARSLRTGGFEPSPQPDNTITLLLPCPDFQARPKELVASCMEIANGICQEASEYGAAVKMVPVSRTNNPQDIEWLWLKDLGPVRRKRPVWFEFGEPFPVEGSGKEEQKKVVDFITSRLTEWGCEVRRNKEEA